MHLDSHHSENRHHDHGHAHGNDHHSHHHHEGEPGPRSGRQGILLSAFGCALPHTHKHYDLFEDEVRQRYPDMEVRRAFTANRVRAKLRTRGMEHLSVAEALSRMVDDGITHVAVQSLHTLPGVEYDWTVQQAKAMRHPRKGVVQVEIGAPLIKSMKDMERVAEVINQNLLPDLGPDDGVILAGHGTYHQCHALYPALEGLLLRNTPNIAVGTLMDSAQPATLGKRFLGRGVRRIFLAPFMCVPGHHVRVDLFGDREHAWERILSSMDIEVVAVPTGSLEYPGFRAIWHDHLDEAVAALS